MRTFNQVGTWDGDEVVLRVLVACEESGTVREAFKALGHDAWSCDILPSRIEGQHYQGDVMDIINEEWDLMIAHPPCTRISNSGVRWLAERNLWDDMREAAFFFQKLLNVNPRIHARAIENPIPHKYALEIIGRKYDQIIQPWQFGHGEVKATCLWLNGLPQLQSTNIVEGREQKIWRMPPGPNRQRDRSVTYKNIADAMALQWGVL